MEVRKSAKKFKLNSTYTQNTPPITMYNHCPSGQLSIDAIKQSVLKRLSIYKSIASKSLQNLSKNALSREIATEFFQAGLDSAASDEVSHFVFRLACSQNEDMRKFFLKSEEAIFRTKFLSIEVERQQRFLKSQGIAFEEVEPRQLAEWRRTKRIGGGESNGPDSQIYYKIPFEKVVDLVMSRSVYLQDGFAVVPKSQVNSVAFSKFRAALSKNLAKTARALHFEKIDERIKPLVDSIASRDCFAKKSFNKNSGAISVTDIEDLAQKSFPLCMRNSYEHLKRDSHLKHGARMHLSLFLKSAGLPYEEASRFWRKSFSKKTDSAKFDKLYAYFIKHNYGKAGSRVSYSPYSCSKIIHAVPSEGDHCGCPFKLFREEQMRAALQGYRLGAEAFAEVWARYRRGDYQLACGSLLHHTHAETKRDEVQIEHPNGYFELSTGRAKAE